MRILLRELLWLMACSVLAFVGTGLLVGYSSVLPGRELDVQMHNTYFVVSWWLALLPLFLVVAMPVTWTRAARVGYRQQTTNMVLAGLTLLTLLLLLLLSFWVWQGMRRH